jgi:hypothetical protein
MKIKASALSLKFVQQIPLTRNLNIDGHPERSVLQRSRRTCISAAYFCNELRTHHRTGIFAVLLAAIVCLSPVVARSESAPGASGQAAGADSSQAPDSSQFAEGTRAINQGHWADAVRSFAGVAAQNGEHADASLYWKAYAEDKLGRLKPSEETCAQLHSGYPRSRWIDDCDALEVEIRAKTGRPVAIEPGQSDEVKLLALNAMMRQDEPRALAEIQAILNGDSSEKLKKEAQFILGGHYSNQTYAQIVRISYVEGDVRIQRGAAGPKSDGATWEKAVADLPLETGFSLATGAGRAEIEFENASTIYLGENSVLTFNDLHTTAGIPNTELALLTGTVSLHIHPYVAGERFILRTPTDDNVVSRFPGRPYVRVESFTDATTITPLEGGDLRLPGVPRESIVPGRTWAYRQGVVADAAGAPSGDEFAAWDKWVSARISAREAATDAVMEASGLTAPIPGMADLAGQGKFFDCAPYGTCWEPKDAANDEAAAHQPGARRQTRFVLASFDPSSLGGQNAQADAASDAFEREVLFPCTPAALRYRLVKDPVTGKTMIIDRKLMSTVPYDWAVCHAGSWIRRNRHYAWVAGCKRHHLEPVRWVKSGRHVGFVPLHPYDVKDQPAQNAKHIVFEVSGKNEIGKSEIKIEPVTFDSSHPVEFLKEPPKEYRSEFLPPLARAEEPRMEAHSFAADQAHKGTGTSRAATPIHFDPKSLSFVAPREEMRDGKTTAVLAPLTNRSGSLQSRAQSFSGGSGARSGSSSGGSSGGFHGGGGGSSSSGSGGFHGGSSSSGGGGFRGGASSSGGGYSAASSSAASSSSSGGSSHH